jgi:fimbrial chaperone protein
MVFSDFSHPKFALKFLYYAKIKSIFRLGLSHAFTILQSIISNKQDTDMKIQLSQKPTKSFSMGLIMALGLVMWLPTSAMAYKFSPMSQVFAPSGAGAAKTFDITNDGPDRVALSISLTTLERDVDYLETNRNADDRFFIYPTQVLLAPGGHQSVRVIWIGEPNPKSELAYRLVVEELLIANQGNTKASSAGHIRTNSRATLYVRPSTATPTVALQSVSYVKSEVKGSLGSLAITVQNTGTAAGILTNCLSTASVGETSVALSPESLGLMQYGRILAGDKRRFLVPWPADLPLGNVKLSLQCDVDPS